MWIHLPTSCLSAPGEAGSTSGSDLLFQTLEQSATWKTKSLRAASWRRAWKKASWTTRLFGQTYDPLMAQRGAESWIASLVATRASHSQLPESASEQPTHATSGLPYQLSFGTHNQSGASLKMSAHICDLDSLRSPETYMKWATKLRQVCLQRRKLARPTSESDSSYWPTATATNAPLAYDESTWNGKHVMKSDGRKHQTDLQISAIFWLTFAGRLDPETTGRLSLNAYGRSRLNPRFVEWLMGWPENWVDLTNFTSSETE